MMTTILLVAAGLVLMGFLFLAARGSTAAKGRLEEVGVVTRPVDLVAFQNLVDPAEDEFLRLYLSPDRFRQVQRMRLRAAVEYVERSAANAAVLLRIGEGLPKQDPAVAEIGREIASAALRLRVYALAVVLVLYFRICFPTITAPVEQLGARYEELRNQFARLARMQRPADAGHLMAAL